MLVHLTHLSSNKKTGPIPVSTSTQDWCPSTCPLSKNGCYADSGPIAIHWRAVTGGRKGMTWDKFCEAVSDFLPTQVWRHNQAGDLPSKRAHSVTLDADRLKALVQANQGRRGFTFTHYDPRIKANAKALEHANAHGFAINLSANNPAHADTLASYSIGPVATLLPATLPVSDLKSPRLHTPEGRRIAVCPAYTHNTNCKDCQLCTRADRPTIVGFPAHGVSVKKAEAVVQIFR